VHVKRGTLIKEYKKSNSLLWICAFFAIFCGLLGSAVLYLTPLLAKDGKTAIAIQGSLSLFALSGFFAFVFWNTKKSSNYSVHEFGIQKQDGLFFPFAEISDVYRFRTGNIRVLYNNLAFRNGPHANWEIISAHLDGSSNVEWLSLYIQQRCTFLQTKHSSPITFYIARPVDSARGKFFSLNATGVVNVETDSLIIESERLFIKGKGYPLADLFPIRLSGADECEIVSKNGESIFKFNYFDLFSADVFIQLFNARTIQDK
jgi:hypothetical protein